MKKHILRKNEDFNKIIKEGKRSSCSHFIVYSLPSLFFKDDTHRVGISVGKKLGNAVVRNSQKRRVRAIVRELEKEQLFAKNDYVIISKVKCLNSSYTMQLKSLKSLLIKELR